MRTPALPIVANHIRQSFRRAAVDQGERTGAGLARLPPGRTPSVVGPVRWRLCRPWRPRRCVHMAFAVQRIRDVVGHSGRLAKKRPQRGNRLGPYLGSAQFAANNCNVAVYRIRRLPTWAVASASTLEAS